ncbi:MAG: hypothetical protein HPY53_01305 [Brevinematales bacterium]|nr:hypothetical protein [Brevinematales bacterium]
MKGIRNIVFMLVISFFVSSSFPDTMFGEKITEKEPIKITVAYNQIVLLNFKDMMITDCYTKSSKFQLTRLERSILLTVIEPLYFVVEVNSVDTIPLLVTPDKNSKNIFYEIDKDYHVTEKEAISVKIAANKNVFLHFDYKTITHLFTDSDYEETQITNMKYTISVNTSSPIHMIVELNSNETIPLLIVPDVKSKNMYLEIDTEDKNEI